ncbi:MAG: hypothetical protein ABI165_21310 [Bryobacteraceae bacterium]
MKFDHRRIELAKIRRLNRRIATLEKTIDEKGSSQLKGHKNLTSIKEIGSLSGSVVLSVIGGIYDVADEGKLAAYLRVDSGLNGEIGLSQIILRATSYSSGEHVGIGPEDQEVGQTPSSLPAPP